MSKIIIDTVRNNKTLTPTATHRRIKTPVTLQVDRVLAEARRRHEQQSAFLARVIEAGLASINSKS